jgi:hypothetical protein
LEADIGGLRFLLRLGDDQVVAAHDPVCRGPREPDVMVLFEMPDDRVRAGIESGGSELVADAQHKLDDVNRCGVGACARPARARLECAVALGAEAGDESTDPGLRDVVVAGDLGL